MTHRVVVRRLAERELAGAVDWYERQRAGLSVELLDEFKGVLAQVTDRPTSFPVAHRDVRRALMNRFPYAVYFRLRGAELVVIAVRHTSRQPLGAWRR